MYQLYDIGYQAVRSDVRLIRQVAEKLGAVIFDVRFSPFSRYQAFTKNELAKELGSLYKHIKELGNVNYKGGPVHIANPSIGMQVLKKGLEIQPVILMCVCSDRETCHRKNIVEMFTALAGGASVISTALDLQACEDLLGIANLKEAPLIQPLLF